MATINGTNGPDDLDGTADNDIINGGAGNDTIAGAGGNDTIDGGAGDDLIEGDGGSGGTVLTGTLGDGPGSTGGTFGDRSGGQRVYNNDHDFTTDAFFLGNDIPVLSDANDDVIDGVTFSQDGVGTDRSFGLQEISFTGAQRGFYGQEVVERSDVHGATDQMSSDGTNFQDIVSVNSGDVKITMNDGTVYNTIEVTFAQDSDGNTFMFPSDGQDPDAFNAFMNLLNTNDSGIASFEINNISGTQSGIFVLDGNWADGQFYEEADAGEPGDDIINGGDGNDTIYGQEGDDTIDGGAGDDTLYGDGAADTTTYTSGTFSWADQGDTDGGSGAVDDFEDIEGETFVDTSGGVTVTVTTPDQSTSGVETDFSTKTINDDGLDDPIDDNSSAVSLAQGGEVGTYSVGFSDPVENVEFNVTDIDANIGQITVIAYDADGNEIDVDFEIGSRLDQSGNTITASSTHGADPNADSNTATISIDGPVASFEITHTNPGTGTSGIHISDINYDVETVDPSAADSMGDDTIIGGAGDDVIYGDNGEDLTGAAGTFTGPRESFNWDLVSGSEADSTVVQDTGDVNVTYTRITDTGSHESNIDNGTNLNTAGIDSGSEPIDTNSSLTSETRGDGNEGGFQWEFDAPVGDVQFNVNDLDGDGVVTIIAYGPDGVTEVPVTLVGGSDININGNTATADGPYQEPNDADTTVQVTIPGPVSRIVLEHEQDGYNNSGINVTDIYFDTGYVPADGTNGEGGDDVITGGEGADVMYGEGGDDTFLVGSADEGAGDVITGGNGPDDTTDNDVLDLRGAGPVTIDAVADASDNGAQSGTVTFEDGSTLEFSQIEEILTDPINEDPDANDDDATVNEDSSVVIDVLGNDTDPNGDTLTVTSATSPDGDVTINSDGTLTFEPNENFNGPTTITYTIDDGNGGTDTATVDVDVTPVNDAPDAVNDNATTPEDTPVTIDVLGNDTDIDGDTLTITGATVPTDQGTVEIVGGELVFTPAEDFNGEATISYSIEDGNGGTDTATVTVNVTPVNDDPVAVDDAIDTDEDTPVIIDLIGNDTDVDGDPLTIGTVSVDPALGEVVDNGDGTVTFTPADDYNGPVTIDYTVEDGNGGEDAGQAIVNVGAVNDGPTANDDDDTTDEDTAIVVDLTANDTDPDGDTLTITGASVPSDQGTLIDNGDGTVTFTPAENFNGEATISYSVTDGNGGTSSATHTVNVTPVNDDPVAVDDIETTDEDQPIVIDLIGNDTDVDGDDLTIGSVSVDPALGEVVDNGDGTVTFTPAQDYNGPVTIDYTVVDGNGGEDAGQAIVSVGAVNDAPVANDDEDTTDEDTSITVDLIGNDTDPDGDALEVINATVPADQGTLVDNGDGTVTFTPADDFNGEATISYEISDNNGGTDTGTHTVNVTPVEDAPITEDDAATTPEDTPVTVDVLANDTDPDGQPLTLKDATVPADQGTVKIVDGKVEFTPADDFNGDATITYTAVDPDGNETPGTLVVDVTPVEDAPITEDDAATTPEDTPVTVDVLANDTDPDGQPLTLKDATVPADQGTVKIVDGKVEFTPADDFNGDATITYTAVDPDGNETPGTLVVDVTPVEDAPITEDDAATTPEDTPVTVDVLANDTDPDGQPLTLKDATVPADQGTVKIVDGKVEFTPADDFNGDATITYTAVDPDGNETPGTLVVDVTPVEDAPITEDDAATTPEDTPVTVDVLANDTDPDGQPLTLKDATVPADQGTVKIVDGKVEFTPADDFNGDATITYTAVDPDGNETPGTLVVDVTPVEDAPITEDDAATTPEDTPVTVDVLANDTDPDGQPLTLKDATVPADQGTVKIVDGKVEFTPADDFNGDATITYTAVDPDGNETPGTLVVDVTPVEDAPITEDDAATTPEDTPVTVDVLANDTDPDGQPLTLKDATVPADQGTVKIVDGKVEFTPADDFNGDATITYTAVDPDGNETPGTLVVDVTPVNDDPVAVDDVAAVGFEETVIIDVLGNDTDVDGDTLSIEGTPTALHGTVTENPDGTLEYTPEAGYDGPDTITYTVSDGNGGTDVGEVAVIVSPSPLDGIVQGTSGDDIIDVNYMDDPQGDRVDADDALLPGEVGDDDIILAGDGNDTILAGEGNDEAYGEDGDDTISGEGGDDYLSGGIGDDVIYGGEGDDTLDAGGGNDTLYGGEGNDTLKGGPGTDLLDGGTGDDLITGGSAGDTIIGGDGSDTVYGEFGDDVIDTSGSDPKLDNPLPGLPGDTPAEALDDIDTVYGGAGNDTITTGDDADFVDGGIGDDIIDSGIDNDVVYGGDGNDTITSGEGSDEVYGGAGDDTIYGGLGPNFPDIVNIPDARDPVLDNGDDLIHGGDGNDTIFGEDDNDEIYGDAGDDTIDGGIDDDMLFGGTGSDTIIGGQGADTLSGGDDRDTFIVDNNEDGIGDVIDGGDGGDDYDTLNLTGAGPLNIVYTSADQEDGYVEYLDGVGGAVTGTLNFTEIENVIPCFTPGTMIATPKGEVDVATLKVGDKVITRDNGLQTIRWVGEKALSAAELMLRKELCPVMIRQGALGNGLPERDMMVSPNHRMLVASEKAALFFEDHEVLVAAKYLTKMDGVELVGAEGVTYIHVMFDRHEVILGDGTWSESFQPGDFTLAGIGEEQREEIFSLFPELREQSGRGHYETARRVLRKHEAELLVS